MFHFHRANKTLGQNFLKSPHALAKIVAAADISAGETVLEIGPGKGALTRALLNAGAHVVAVEKDAQLIPILQETCATEISAGTLTLIHGDILEIKHIEEIVHTPYKLVANIPYYITGQIIRTFLSEHVQPTRMVLLLQKEVVERIVAHDAKESLLSLAVKAYGTPKKVAVVKRGDFSPVPNVDSAILLIADISKKNFPDTHLEQRFFDILHAGFSHKRKKLSRNLEAAAEKEAIERAFTTLNLNINTRAEDLSLETWIRLAQSL